MSARIVRALAWLLLVACGCGGTGPEDYHRLAGSTQPGWPSTAPATRPRERPPGPEAHADLPESPTLSDCLAYALANSPALEEAFHRWQAALARVPQARSLPDPRLTYSAERESGPGLTRTGFELAQMFPWFGKLDLRAVAEGDAAGAEYQRLQAEALRLFQEVTESYSEWYYLGQAVAVTEESMELLKRVEGLARTRYQVAAAEHPDVIRAQVELGRLSEQLRSLRDQRPIVVGRLNAALNRPPSAPLADFPQVLKVEKVRLDEGELLAALGQTSPELKAMDSEIARGKQMIELARKEYYPDVMLAVEWMEGRGQVPDMLVGMVSVNLPIWFERLEAGVREAERNHRAAVHRRAQKANVLAADLQAAMFAFRDAERKMDLYRDTLVPKARQSILATEAAYRAGRAGFSDLIDAQRVLLEFELSYRRALADRTRSLARVEMLVGRPLSGVGKPADAPGGQAK